MTTAKQWKEPLRKGYKVRSKIGNQQFWKQGCVSHCGLAKFTLKSILMQKKNYGNSNISPHKNTIFKKSCKWNQNPSRYYNSITNSSFNTSLNIIFQKSSCKNRHMITQGPKSFKLLYSIMNLNTPRQGQ